MSKALVLATNEWRKVEEESEETKRGRLFPTRQTLTGKMACPSYLRPLLMITFPPALQMHVASV